MNNELLIAMYRTLQDLIKENEELSSSFNEKTIDEKKELAKVMEARVKTFYELKECYLRYKANPTEEIMKEIYDRFQYTLAAQISKLAEEKKKTVASDVDKKETDHKEDNAVEKAVNEVQPTEQKSINGMDSVPISFPTISRITPPSIKKEEVVSEQKPVAESEMPELRTISEWCDIYGYEIISPDGFDRETFSLDNIISEDEFRVSIQNCTIQPKEMKL